MMNDVEIVKAFRSCRVSNICTKKCPCYTSLKCTEELDKSILSIIKRQKAEIERLKDEKEKLLITYDRHEWAKPLSDVHKDTEKET